jgi:hypothetical protein
LPSISSPTLTPEVIDVAKTPYSTPTLDMVAESISRLKATDQARSPESFKADLDEIPLALRQSAVRIDLKNAETDSYCDGTLVDVRPHPTDQTKQIMIIYTAAHCLDDQNYNKYTRATLVQPHNNQTPIDGQRMVSIRGRGDFGVIALISEQTDIIKPLGMENILSASEFIPGMEMFGLGFTDYAENNKTIFPGKYSPIDGTLVPVMGVDMSSLNVYQVDGVVSPGLSGMGIGNREGRLMGTITGPGEYENRVVTSVYPIPKSHLTTVQQAVELLLTN